MSKIIGLFEDEQDVACAVKGLYSQGFNQEEIELINPNPFSQQRLISRQDRRQVAATVNLDFVNGAAITRNSSLKAGAEAVSSVIDPTGMLTKMGIPEAEACFYGVNVKRGNRLVIVHTGNERALEAQQIIRQANARVSTGYD